MSLPKKYGHVYRTKNTSVIFHLLAVREKLKQTQNGMEEEGMLLLQAFTTIWHNDIEVVWKENWYDKEGEIFRQENHFDSM